MKAIINLIFILIPILAFGQNENVIEPDIGDSYKYTTKEQKDWEQAWKILNDMSV